LEITSRGVKKRLKPQFGKKGKGRRKRRITYDYPKKEKGSSRVKKRSPNQDGQLYKVIQGGLYSGRGGPLPMQRDILWDEDVYLLELFQ